MEAKPKNQILKKINKKNKNKIKAILKNQILKKITNKSQTKMEAKPKNQILKEVDQMHPDPFKTIHNLVNLPILLIHMGQLHLLNKNKQAAMILHQLVKLDQFVSLKQDNVNVLLVNLDQDVINLNNNKNIINQFLKKQLKIFKKEIIILKKNYHLKIFLSLLLN